MKNDGNMLLSTVFSLLYNYLYLTMALKHFIFKVLFNSVLITMIINRSAVEKAASNAVYARDNLIRCKEGKWLQKVCCICDRIIKYGQESKIRLDDIRHQAVCHEILKDSLDESDEWKQLSKAARRQILIHYTAPCYKSDEKWLKKYVLSPCSYEVEVGNRKEKGLGCCLQCKGQVDYMKREFQNPTGITYAIANGLFIGGLPDALRDLSDSEYAFISIGRIDRHIFSFQAGAHKSIQGWHSMYYNDIAAVSKVTKWCKRNTQSHESDDEDDNDTEFSDDEDSDNDDNDGMEEDGSNRRKKFSEICVVLCGPFTSAQRAQTLKRTKVRWNKIDAALKWLKKNNPLYKDFDYSYDDFKECQPYIVDDEEIEATRNSNVEKQFEIHAVFPDGNEPTDSNGGCKNKESFRDVTVERMLAAQGDKEITLFARPTTTFLRDYEGQNMLKAFPHLFPYGIGGNDKDGEPRTGVGYVKYLSTLSDKRFHRPEVSLVLFNTIARKRMVRNSYLKCPDGVAESFSSISIEQMENALHRMNNKESSQDIADVFLRKMKAVTSSLPHSVEGAKKARQSLYCMEAALGIPACMFTITPDDSMCYRIRVSVAGKDGEPIPPKPDEEETVLREFVVDCSRIREQYPGLCAIEFENVIAITIEHFLGWDRKRSCNKEDEGFFGNLNGYAYAVEEQGRKTLHAHFLLWVRDWEKVLDGLANPALRDKYKDILEKYGSEVMSTHMFGVDPKVVPRDCPATCANTNDGVVECQMCTDQDLRSMRTKAGESSFGGKNIFRCSCGQTYCSERITINRIKSLYGGSVEVDSLNSFNAMDLWSRNQVMSKTQLRMEIDLMNALLPQSNVRETTHYRPGAKVKFITSALRNLHKSYHCGSCFKKDHECRMKLPHQRQPESCVFFDEKETNWFDPLGRNTKRNLFVYEPKRSHADSFMNVHNSKASTIFGCNTNVIAGVDGGSIMYVTCYISKNTQKEDNAHFTKAAAHMAKKMADFNASVNEEGSNEGDVPDRVLVGVKGMIGAVLMGTQSHKIAAPMASYLIRNDSRFQFSHRFAYVNLRDFFQDSVLSYEIDTTEEGEVFLKSVVANYLFRPVLLEEMCLYEFLRNYSAMRPSDDSIPFLSGHPSQNKLQLKHVQSPKVPMINFLDFEDTKNFEGFDLLSENELNVNDTRRHHVELYCQRVLTCFVPFRRLDEDLRVEGSYWKKFRTEWIDGSILSVHKRILRNIQDCRNSLNAGRPKDMLERITTTPPRPEKEKNNSTEEEEAFSKDLDDLMENVTTHIDNPHTNFRDCNNMLSFDSMLTRGMGSNGCGVNNIVSPKNVPDVDVINVPVQTYIPSNTSSNSKKDALDPEWLHKVTCKIRERLTVNVNGEDILTVKPTGTLKNIREYACDMFGDDKDQKKAFESIMAAFVLELYAEAKRNVNADMQEHKKRKIESEQTLLQRVNSKDISDGGVPQPRTLIAFLSGAGGSGKSHVIKTCVRYAKGLCEHLNVSYNKRTIVVTALTGSAAVEIGGETTHSALALQKKKIDDIIDDFKNAYLIIIDEISFASKKTLEMIERKLRELKEQPNKRFGGIPVIFAGDFTQLKPVGANPIYLFTDFDIWYDWVNTFIELRSNHRFKHDQSWGELLLRYRDAGPSKADVDIINSRLIGSRGGPKEHDIPADAVYATKTNRDRMAINDAIFVKHLENTHSMDPSIPIPNHTICVLASDLRWKKPNTQRDYIPMNNYCRDIVHTSVGEAFIKDKENKYHSSMLKLYRGRPLMMTQNRDVENCIANGAMCEFHSLTFKEGSDWNCVQKIRIDGYYVWCVSACHVKSLNVKMIDGVNGDTERIVNLEAENCYATAKFPLSVDGPIGPSSFRICRKMSMLQFPVNCANARTVHKLQGRSIKNLVINAWDYTGNWIYVALSRVTKLSGLFIRKRLLHRKTRGMSLELQAFLQHFRKTKQLPPSPIINTD